MINIFKHCCLCCGTGSLESPSLFVLYKTTYCTLLLIHVADKHMWAYVYMMNEWMNFIASCWKFYFSTNLSAESASVKTQIQLPKQFFVFVFVFLVHAYLIKDYLFSLMRSNRVSVECKSMLWFWSLRGRKILMGLGHGP